MEVPSVRRSLFFDLIYSKPVTKLSEIKNILEKLQGTEESEILVEMEKAYRKINDEQAEWYARSKFTCPEGCGGCCHNFEPDLMKSEAIYMAAWLIENQNQIAEKVAEGKYPFDNGKTCPFYNPDIGYHCSIYGGRPFICRLFGASGSHSKTGEIVWKPCKFYPAEALDRHNPPLVHRQYSQQETKSIFGTLPPVMGDLMEQAVSFSEDYKNTKLIREILPETIQKLKWIVSMKESNQE